MQATFHDVLEFVIGGEVAQQHEAEVVLEVRRGSRASVSLLESSRPLVTAIQQPHCRCFLFRPRFLQCQRCRSGAVFGPAASLRAFMGPFRRGQENGFRRSADLVNGLQVWDYNMINHFKGRVQVPLREVIRQRRLEVRFASASLGIGMGSRNAHHRLGACLCMCKHELLTTCENLMW
jgi:hypothetical protein